MCNSYVEDEVSLMLSKFHRMKTVKSIFFDIIRAKDLLDFKWVYILLIHLYKFPRWNKVYGHAENFQFSKFLAHDLSNGHNL